MAWFAGRATTGATWMPAVYSLVLSVLVLGPLLGPGYLLLRDAVSTPRSYVTDSALGTTDAAARAVPQDAFVATLTTVVDGGIVVKTVLLLALWFAGWGAAQMARTLLPTAGTPALLVAATVAIWNPYVAERLLQGHWSLLVGYAALPWTVVAALAYRRRGQWAWLAVCLAAAGLTPTGAVLAAITALVVVATGRSPGKIGWTVALATWASLPWLVATAVSGGGTVGADPAGVTAFAARAEPGLGTLGSLAGLGGIWNSDAVPTSRTSPFAVAGTLVLLAVVGLGVWPLWRRRRHSTITVLAVLAVVAVLGVALAATGPGLRLGEWAATDVPGAGLLRDGQKWVALALPFYVLAAAAGVAWLNERTRTTWAPAVVGVLALLVALPDLVWGVGGALRPVQYPASWSAVANHLAGAEGDVAVLPAGMFRIFPYSGDVPVLDPAPRMLPLDVLQTGELIVAGGTVRGEGSRAADVEKLLLSGGDPDQLASYGVGWVLVEKTTPGELGDSADTLNGLDMVFEDDQLALYEVPGDHADHADVGSDTLLVAAAHLAWAALLAGGLLWSVCRAPARRHQSRQSRPGH